MGSPRHAVFKMRSTEDSYANPLHKDTAPGRPHAWGLHKWVGFFLFFILLFHFFSFTLFTFNILNRFCSSVCSCLFPFVFLYLQVDFNQDGFIDYVASKSRFPAKSNLFLNKPPSTPKFTEDTTVFDEGLGSMHKSSAAHSLWDFDNDGDFDLLVLGATSSWKPFMYWENTGTKYKAVWTQREDAETNPFLLMNMPTASGASGRKSKYFVVYDLDADGDGDVIVSSQVGKFFIFS